MTDQIDDVATAEIEAALADDDAAAAAHAEAEVIAARIIADTVDANPGAQQVLERNEKARDMFVAYAVATLPALLLRLEAAGMSGDEAQQDVAEPLTADVLRHIVTEAVVGELTRAGGTAGPLVQGVTPHPGSEVPVTIHRDV